MSDKHASARLMVLKNLLTVAVIVTLARVFLGVLSEYRWYFPPDFEQSAFLSGRKFTFVGVYRWAFYVHILSGPVAVVLGTMLILSGGRGRMRLWHRSAGKLQVLLILLAVVPSGLLMACQAYAGPAAGLGFASHSLATGISAVAAAYFAQAKNFRKHRCWAWRCFILLVSPFVLRLVSGMAIVTNMESERFYILNSWFSWLVPLAMLEVWNHRARLVSTFARRKQIANTEESHNVALR